MSDSYLPDNEPRDILWSLEELSARKLSHAHTFRKAADEISRLRGENKKLQAEADYYHGEWQKVIVAISDKFVHMRKLEDCLREIRQLTNEVLS